MRFIAATCPHCDGELQVPDDRDIIKCMYCGEDIVVQQAVRPIKPNIGNLLELAQAALSAGNHDEALGYFNKVLEHDPTNTAAWMGKGTAAGWSSTIRNFRLPEMLVAFENALNHASESEDAIIREECAHTINAVAVAYYSMVRKHMLEFVALRNTWEEYLSQSRHVISAFETASLYAPEDYNILENLVQVCKDNIEGITYKDPYDNDFTKSWSLSSTYEAEIRSRMLEAANKIKQFDPSYEAPEAKRPSAKCFVVTATFGCESHPAVSLLRSFRDEKLQYWRFGRAFVRWYYVAGPKIAQRIETSRLARFLSYLLVVVPAVSLVRVYYALTSGLGGKFRAQRQRGSRP